MVNVANDPGVIDSELTDSPIESAAELALVKEQLDRQTAALRRLEDADRALVQIVLTGGTLDELCERVVSFLDPTSRAGAMVTTTDGRVVARAGAPEDRLERSLAVAHLRSPSTTSTARAALGCASDSR